jgi:DNA-binding LacI/PurR family transcriptional regulator
VSTIQDVANHAGVSISTVSNVLNGRGDRMGKDTLARVEAAIAALNFRPNRVARQLKTGHTPMLGMLVPSIANPMYGYIAREIETIAQERHGYRVMLGNTYRDQEKEASFIEDLLSYGVRGVIVISSRADEKHIESAVRQGMVVVSYDRRATPDAMSGIDHVSVDNFRSACLATEHLIEQGHTRLAFVTASGRTMSRTEKVAGFWDAVDRAGLRDQAQVFELKTHSEYGDSEMSAAGREQASLIMQNANRPTAVVAINDMLALGLMAGFRTMGLQVPSDISVVGMDDMLLSSLVSPELSTVRMPVAEMANTIVERIVSRLADPEIAPAEFLFQPVFVPRESVRPMPRQAQQSDY